MVDKEKILIVEDDEYINNLLNKILSKEGYRVTAAYSGTEADIRLKMDEYDLILLDLMLPGITGEEIIEKIRLTKYMPIIVISAKSDSEEKIKVLRLGADDYVLKPFEVDELLARVEAQLRRYRMFSGKKNTIEESIIYKNICINKEEMKVEVNGKELTLTAREYAILDLLLSNPKKVFTRSNLYERVWKDEFYGDDNTINVHMSNIRSKIAMYDNENDYIKTVWGIGFKMAE